MSRMYIVNHWNDAAAYSGEQIGDRLKDSSALHFNRDGSANVNLYSEETAQSKKKSSVSLEDRILPQAARVRRLTEQLIELEQERKNGMNIHRYSELRDILVAKRNRAEVLLKRARNLKPVRQDDESPVAHTQPIHSPNHSENSHEKGQFSVKSGKADAVFFVTGICVCFVVFMIVKSIF